MPLCNPQPNWALKHRSPHFPLFLRSLFQHVRNETAIDEPILSVEYLKGSNCILALACGFTDTEQLACT